MTCGTRYAATVTPATTSPRSHARRYPRSTVTPGTSRALHAVPGPAGATRVASRIRPAQAAAGRDVARVDLVATPAIVLDVDGREVRVTNPDKVYFPGLGSAGGTKRHLVEYYLAVRDG